MSFDIKERVSMKLTINLNTKEVSDFVLEGMKRKHPEFSHVRLRFNVANLGGSYYDDGVGVPAFVGCDLEVEEDVEVEEGK